MFVCSAFLLLLLLLLLLGEGLSASVPHLSYLQLLVDFLNKYLPFAGVDADKEGRLLHTHCINHIIKTASIKMHLLLLPCVFILLLIRNISTLG